MSQFAFVQREWPSVYDAAVRGMLLCTTSAGACGRVGYKHDPALRLPYDDKISALIHEPSFKQTAGEAVFSKARVNLIVNHLTEHGVMEAARLYESPFTDLMPHGPEGLFSQSTVDELIAVLDEVRRTAVAA